MILIVINNNCNNKYFKIDLFIIVRIICVILKSIKNYILIVGIEIEEL